MYSSGAGSSGGGGGEINLRSRGGGGGSNGGMASHPALAGLQPQQQSSSSYGGGVTAAAAPSSGYPQAVPSYLQQQQHSPPQQQQQAQQHSPAHHQQQQVYGGVPMQQAMAPGRGVYAQPSQPQVPSYSSGAPLQGAFPQASLPSQTQQGQPGGSFYSSSQQQRPGPFQPQQQQQMHSQIIAPMPNTPGESFTQEEDRNYGVRRTGASQRSSPPPVHVGGSYNGSIGGGGGGSYQKADKGGYFHDATEAPIHTGIHGGLAPPPAGDDRLRRKQNSDSLNNYIVFMYGLLALSLGVMLLAWFTLGSAAKYVVLVLSICMMSFMFTLKLTQWIFAKDDANPAMRVISEAIREGSEGFLRVQYTAIGLIAMIIAALIAFIYLFRSSPSAEVSPATLAVVTGVSYIIGAFCSGLAGYIGVWVSIRVNIRVAVAASKHSFKDALLLSFRGGAVSACLSASLCILGVTILYVFCYLFFVTWGSLPARHVPMLLVGYGFGGALVALFMQLGGGIYTKAADVGADMCGKVEAGIPEDDPRNPAVIADLVGDNVGDCAGSMADVYESIAAEVIGTMMLGAALAAEAKLADPEPWIFFPLIIHSLDLLISGVGIMLTVPQGKEEDPLTTMKRAYGVCMVLAAVGFAATCRFLLYTPVAPSAWWNFTLCGWIGILMSYLIIRSTQYYTDGASAPVKRIAAASQTGHGTNVIAGLAVGLESTCAPTCIIAFALLAAFTLGKNSGLPGTSAGVFGTAVATMGMLCTAVFVLSMNNFGPIADNAGGIVEMSGQPHDVRVITDKLDSVGNVTKAASKGYAVGGSALSCFVLFQAYLDEISAYSGVAFDTINIAKVEVVCGGLLGMMMIFLFAGWAMQSVGNTAQKVVWEVRRQFKNKPGIMDGSEKPDYDTCVAIVTREALKEMVWPALLALLLPVAVGFGFKAFGSYTGRPQLGVEVVAAFMMFGTLAGLLMAMFMDNAGGAWDNAKKLIESQGQKGSEAHKAAVTGDTVGDPFKDTAGPALHVIITTMSTTVLVLGPLFAGASAVVSQG